MAQVAIPLFAMGQGTANPQMLTPLAKSWLPIGLFMFMKQIRRGLSGCPAEGLENMSPLLADKMGHCGQSHDMEKQLPLWLPSCLHHSYLSCGCRPALISQGPLLPPQEEKEEYILTM